MALKLYYLPILFFPINLSNQEEVKPCKEDNSPNPQYCYFLTEEASYPTSCKYDGALIYSEYQKFLSDLPPDLTPLWLPVLRTSKLGLLYWQDPSNYMSIYKDNNEEYLYKNDISSKDCIIYHQNTTEAVNCLDQHNLVCFYKNVVRSNQKNSDDNFELHLSYDGSSKLIITTLNNGQWFNKLKVPLSCFTDAGATSFLTKLTLTALETSPNLTYSFNTHVNGPGSYWCDAITYSSLVKTSNRIFLRLKETFPGEYVGHIKSKYVVNTNPLTDQNVNFLNRLLTGLLNGKSIFKPRSFIFSSLNEDELELTSVWHFTSKESIDSIEEYEGLKLTLEEAFKSVKSNDLFVELLQLLSVDYCLEEKTIIDEELVTWPKTNFEQEAFPLEGVCLDDNLISLSRTCQGDFIQGAVWSPIKDCTLFKFGFLSKKLSKALENGDPEELFTIISALEEHYLELQPIDLHYIAEILEQFSLYHYFNLNEENIKLLVSMVNTLNKVPVSVVEESEKLLQATTKILEYFQRIIDDFNQELQIVDEDIVILKLSLENSSFFGLEFRNSTLKILSQLEDLSNNFDTALIIKQISDPNVQLSIISFKNNVFFRSDEDVSYQTSNVLKLRISQVNVEITMLFQNGNSKIVDTLCSKWDTRFWYSYNNPKYSNNIFECPYIPESYITFLTYDNLTASLEDLRQSNEEKSIRLSNLTKFSKELSNYDVQLVFEILEYLVEIEAFKEEILITFDNLMLLKSDIDFNLRIDLLNTFKKVISTKEFQSFSGKNLEMLYLKPTEDAIGVAIDHTENYKFIHNKIELNQVFKENFKTILLFQDVVTSKILLVIMKSDNLLSEQPEENKDDFLTFFYVEDNLIAPLSVVYNHPSFKAKNCEIWLDPVNEIKLVPPEINHGLMQCNLSPKNFLTTSVDDSKNITQDLEAIFDSDSSVFDKQKLLQKLIQTSYNILEPYDIFLVSEILRQVAEGRINDLEATSSIIQHLHQVDSSVLNKSQNLHQATDRVLNQLDQITLNSNETWFFSDKEDLFKLVIFEFAVKQFKGIIIKNCSKTCEIILVEEILQLEHLNIEDLNSVLIFSQELAQQLLEENQKIIFSLFINDRLFNFDNTENLTVSKIFSITFPGLKELKGNFSIIYNTKSTPKGCAFWKYDFTSSGFWNIESKQQASLGQFSICTYEHLTHFALLLTGNKIYEDNLNILDMITNVNCLLTAGGIFVILLTGYLFPAWRNSGNIILVNFSLSISIKIILLYISNEAYSHQESLYGLCEVFGALLHYALMSEFSWMLIIAILQFKRFVEVLSQPTSNILIKSCVCGWLLPILPVICVVVFDKNGYSGSRVGLCYASGLGLYLGVWLPIAIIVAINIVIFVFIIYNVCHRKIEQHVHEPINHEILFQWRLALLLFFMLGLTWLFGFVAVFEEGFVGIVFLYLFCFTASLQGFVLFLFFIVFNKSTRALYWNYFKTWLITKNLKKF